MLQRGRLGHCHRTQRRPTVPPRTDISRYHCLPKAPIWQLAVKKVRCRYSAALLREGPRFAVDLGGTPISRARPRIAPDLQVTVGMGDNLVEADSN